MKPSKITKGIISLLVIFWLVFGWPPIWQHPQFPPKVPTLQAATENRYATSHITGAFSNPTNANGSTTGTWAGDVNTNSNYTSRWAMDDPTAVVTGAQTINIMARKGSNSGTPTIAINLYENGTSVRAILPTTNVTSTTGQILSGTFPSTSITNFNNVEIEVIETGQGGSGSVRNSAQIDYIQWVVNYNAAPSISISQPDGTGDTVNQGDSYNVTYTLNDSDSVVTAAFYYDTNNTGLDGTALSGACASAAEGTSVTCSWNTTGITPGSYYIYGIASDGVTSVNAYSPGQITINAVTISIAITSDGTISYGNVGVGTSQSTVALADTQIAQNDGNITENFNIKTSDATGGTTWTVGTSAGTNIFVHDYSTTSGSSWTTLTTTDSYQALASGIGVGNTRPFDMRITVPTTSSDYVQKTITITVQAVQP